MKGCNYIKKRIDEADKPGLLSFEVTEHISNCGDCERFASERTRLRNLVASGSRVSTPMNFDAILNARLAEVKARRSFWWLSSPGYLRLGAATAGLVVMIFAAQYAGFLTDQSKPANGSQARDAVPIPIPIPIPEPYDRAPSVPEVMKSLPGPMVATGRNPYPGYPSTMSSGRRRGDLVVGRVVPAGFITAEDGGVVLVRGQNGEMDVQMPTVSVGAQPLLYVRAGQRTVGTVGTSF